MSALAGTFTQRSFDYDGGRLVTAYLPPDPARSVIYAADGGWHLERLAAALEAAGERTTMVVGVHGLDDDDGRLHEYIESFGGDRFLEFERFFVDDVRTWVKDDLGVDVPAVGTAVWGASLGGELSLAMGLRHPDVYGAMFCASPGGGFTPASTALPESVPRSYLVGGRQEEWFLDNAKAWATALQAAGHDVVIEERDGDHGGSFWYEELPAMVAWALSS